MDMNTSNELFRAARRAAGALNRTAPERIDELLRTLADTIEAETEPLVIHNTDAWKDEKIEV